MQIFKQQQKIGNTNNLKAIEVSISRNEILIKANPDYFVVGTKLHIKRQFQPIYKDVSLKYNIQEENRAYNFSAFLGILSFKNYGYDFLVMVQDAKKVATIQKQDIFQILKVHMICIERDEITGNQTKSINCYLQQISNILQTGHYFSFSYSISQSLEDQNKYPFKPNIQFLWNYHFMDPLRNNNLVCKKWCIQLIQGFVTQFTTLLKDNQPIQYTLITRRSSLRGGTRYNHRGVDEDGNVANYCESEQILQLGSICCSHTQIRGSVPLFWEQKGFQATLQLTKTEEENKKALLKHFQKIKQDYKNVMCVNLMSKTKNLEQQLTQQFENSIQKCSLDFLRYKFFDFHEACKGFNYQNINELAESLKLILYSFKFFALDQNTSKSFFEQTGVIRTNCLDCLDRTNVFMTKIAGIVIEYMMNHMNKQIIKEFDSPILNLIDGQTQGKKIHPFMINFKHAWADNGDQISKHYAGTGATTSKATKQGNIGIMGFLDQSLKGIERFYKGNFEDSYKQECLDIIIGRNRQSIDQLDKSIIQNSEELQEYQKAEQKQFQSFEQEQKNVDLEIKKFCIQDKNNINLNLLTITWNTQQFNIQDQNIEEACFLCFERSIPPDFIFFTFQNINTIDHAIQGFWFQLISKCIMQFGQEYKMVSYHFSQNSKIMIIAYVLSSLPYSIIQLQIDEIVSPIFGDEQKIYGCVGVKYLIESSYFAFLSCYLPEKSEDNEKRIQLLNEYMKNIFKQNYSITDNQQNQYQDQDVQILLGNLNFQIALSSQIIQEHINNYQRLKQENNYEKLQKCINFLLDFDQFKNYQKLQNFLSNYVEGQIEYLPQLKKKADQISEHKYSWFDRICVNKNQSNIEYQIQSYQQHEEILESYSSPISFSVVFNLPKQFKDTQNTDNQKYLNQEQKVFLDAQNAPYIFEFFKPPQALEKQALTKLKHSRSGQENIENNSLSLDASVTMIMNTHEEEQDDQSQCERYSLIQNILNENNLNNQYYEQEVNIKKSQNCEQESLQQQQQENNLNSNNKQIKAETNVNNQNKDSNSKQINNVTISFFNNNHYEQEDRGQQFQLPLIKDYITSKEQNEDNRDKKYLKQSQNNSLKNLQNFEINQKEDEETEDQAQQNRHRKMSSFDICFIEDKSLPEEKKALQVIKEE
ncbi:hypothetical protein ABPG72_005633 [Tetrahymena utriculariae]